MELLFAAITTLIVEFHKKYMKNVGQEMTESMVYLGVFMLVLFWTILTQFKILSWETVLFIGKVFMISVGTFEVVVKRIIRPLILKLFPPKIKI